MGTRVTAADVLAATEPQEFCGRVQALALQLPEWGSKTRTEREGGGFNASACETGARRPSPLHTLLIPRLPAPVRRGMRVRGHARARVFSRALSGAVLNTPLSPQR